MPSLTPQLLDEGEESWQYRVHVGCGRIYLDGYINADSMGMHPHENPSLVERNRTTVDNYWGSQGAHNDLSIGRAPLRDEIAIDLLTHPTELRYNNQIEKIVCIRTFEHFTEREAKKALLSWWNAMKPGAILIISVPDPAVIAQFLDLEQLPNRLWELKKLFRGGLNTYSLQYWAYTEQNLRHLLIKAGFFDIQRLESVHPYPAIVLKCRKNDPWLSKRDYQVLGDLSKCKKILDVGPGEFPLAGANYILDHLPPKRLERGQNFVLCDLNTPSIPYPGDFFDFVYCSHVLEHLRSPVEALEELQRVGKRGFVEVPSMFLDFMLKHGQNHPRWLCWGSGNNDLLFIGKTAAQNRLFLDSERTWGAFFYHAIHGSVLSPYQHAARAFFWQNQELLNIQARWDENSHIEALEMRISEDSGNNL